MRFTYEYVKSVIETHGDTLITKKYNNYRQRLTIVCHKCKCQYEQTFQCIQRALSICIVYYVNVIDLQLRIKCHYKTLRIN
jgi:hypothetical protein